MKVHIKKIPRTSNVVHGTTHMDMNEYFYFISKQKGRKKGQYPERVINVQGLVADIYIK